MTYRVMVFDATRSPWGYTQLLNLMPLEEGLAATCGEVWAERYPENLVMLVPAEVEVS